MNSFYEHHKDSIRWHYRCFDRILLNGLIQPFQQPERVVGFFNTYRQLYPVSRNTLRGIAEQFQAWLKAWAGKRSIPVIEAPQGRRDEFVDPYFHRAKPDEIVVILKAREPARIMTAIGDSKTNRWHLQIANRWVVQYNFYINSRPASASINITGLRTGCASRASTSSSAAMPSPDARRQSGSSNLPTRSIRGSCRPAAKSGWRG
jgi:Tfp pilus tip-associated adhesin PilY1